MDASAEAVGPIKASPEVPVGAENLTEWDTPPGAAGRAAPEVPMEDEDSPTAQLVEEGVEQADRDRRIAAADPDQQP